MTEFVAVKALAGFNYVRPDQVVGIAASDPTKCTIYLTGGVTIPSSEPAKDVMAKLEAASLDQAREPQKEPN
ncbi:MAG: hypothetical protein ABSC22_20810 [Roseiarcus sp.]|jgi:hypothetical protein